MIYSNPLSNCGPSTPEYVYSSTKIALDRTIEGDADGVVLYCLDKTNLAEGFKYDLIKNLYSKYRLLQ
jgi:hypothetical protein